MARLDQERQSKFEPERLKYAKSLIQNLGYKITWESKTELQFYFKGEVVKFFPYSGWHTGKTINDGRGIEKLLKQIK